MEAAARADLEHGTIPRMVVAGAGRFGDRPAVIDGEASLSFAQLATEMERAAAALVAAGVGPGDRVALWAPNSIAWIPAALGILAAGAWLVPLNTRFKGAEAAYILGRTDARMLLVVDGFLGVDLAAMVAAEAPGLRALGQVVRLPPPGEYAHAGWNGFLAAAGEADLGEARRRIAAGGPDDVADVIFTSGTTGHPKGVMLRHGTSLRCYQSLNSGYGLVEGDVHLVPTPFFHCFGYKAGWMLDLLVGATTVPVAVFDSQRAMELIERHRVTHLPGSPTIFWALINHPERDRHDLSSLRTALVSAAAIPVELVHRMRDDLGIDTVMTGYGLTENHALGAFTRPDDPPHRVATTVGRMAPDLEVRIVDEGRMALPAGEAGEVEIAGYAHMSGYYQDPEATAAAIRDGWLATGDIGVLDPDGYLRITDRKKDMYVMGGFNVAPAEVEKALMGLAGVAEVAVIGVADEHFGEVGAAYVVTLPGSGLTAAEVTRYARERLANYKVPRHVELVDELPHNATGKVQKHVLRDLPRSSATGGG